MTKKIIDIKTKYIDYPCEVEYAVYRNGQPAIRLNDAETGEPAATATASLEGVVDIDWQSDDFKGKTAIKNYSENEGMLEALEKAGIIKQTQLAVETQYVTFPIVEVL